MQKQTRSPIKTRKNLLKAILNKKAKLKLPPIKRTPKKITIIKNGLAPFALKLVIQKASRRIT